MEVTLVWYSVIRVAKIELKGLYMYKILDLF